MQHRRALYVAAFLHDIAKGRDEDHSIVGARIARALGPRLGLTPAEVETTAWLIEQHLTMSQVAFSRDIGDPKTVRDFANIVQSPERLKLLLVLTVADIRAVGPGIWNGWKGQLLRALYYEAEPLVAGGHTQLGARERVAAAQEAFRSRAWPIGRRRMWSASSTGTIPTIGSAPTRARPSSTPRWCAPPNSPAPSSPVTTRPTRSRRSPSCRCWRPTIPACWRCLPGRAPSAGANISGAHISTTRDGFALDTFLLAREFEQDEDELRRARRIAETIEKLLKGEIRLSSLMAKRHGRRSSRIGAFTVAPEVLIDNTLSNQFTVVEVSGLDRPGLLFELTNTLSDLNLDITSAHVTTFGEKVVDVFYVTDLTSKQVTSPQRQKAIKARLMDVLAAPGA